MNLLKRCLIGVLVLTITGLYFPRLSFCDAKGTSLTSITRHAPQMKSMPEEDIDLMPKAKGEKKMPTWLMVGLGVVLVAGLAAAAGGGGGGGGGTDPGPEDPGPNPGGTETGSVSVGW